MALATGWCPGLALADGDPASDVLASQTLFLPQDAGVTPGQQARLGVLLHAAQKDHYQIRVAMIASPADLGSVTELWRQPQNYARFLAQELSLVYRGPVIIVMPNGYGFAGPLTTSEHTALAGLRGPSSNLATATFTAIERLATASGHSLPLPKVTAPSTPSSSETSISWLVFAIGTALIVITWTASLRALPLDQGR